MINIENGSVKDSSLSFCRPFYIPDIPLKTATAVEIAEIETIFTRLRSTIIGSTPPNEGELSRELTNFHEYGIVGTGSSLSKTLDIDERDAGKTLQIFAKLVYNAPTDSRVPNIRQKSLDLIRAVHQQHCEGIYNIPDLSHYEYVFYHWAKGVIPFRNDMDENMRLGFGKSLDIASNGWVAVWKDLNGSQKERLSDVVYGVTEGYLGYATFIMDADERVQFMKAFKRYLEIILAHSSGVNGMLKPDGSSYHHKAAYVGYMYSFNHIASTLYALSGSSFQIDQSSYLNFRDTLLWLARISNDNRRIPLSAVGRNPQLKRVVTSSTAYRQTALAGGEILGLTTADPVLAGYYNRVFGVYSGFDYSITAPFETGFFQFNYATAGVIRHDNWVASMAGFSSKLWGAEIYQTSNLYGRYQSYGTLEILYPGDNSSNGLDIDTWDWNHNPGSTSILHTFPNLHSERGRLDEKQQRNFVGSLAFDNQNSLGLSRTSGLNGVFAMEFQEQTGKAFSTPSWHKETHNNSFTFKKSYFAFDDMIVALGSNISNNNALGETITTLYQRRTNGQPRSVNVNGNSLESGTNTIYSDSLDHKVISNYNTGYYLVAGSGRVKVKIEKQQTPNHNQNLNQNWSRNPSIEYAIAYLDHGMNPSNQGYEYVCLPNTSDGRMIALEEQMTADSNRPYQVKQKDGSAHIVKHEASQTWGYAFFDINTNLSPLIGIVKSNDHKCLVMYRKLNNRELKLSLNNPDISTLNGALKNIHLTLHGDWVITSGSKEATLVSASDYETVIQFATKDGMPIEIVLENVN